MINHIKESWYDLLIAVSMGGLGGFLYYLTKVEEGKKFSWTSCLLNIAVSGFAGLITFILLHHLVDYDYEVCGAFSGIAGWMGTRLLNLVEQRIAKKIEN